MRRLTIIGTALITLLTGLGVTGAPSQAAAHPNGTARVKVHIDSLSGNQIWFWRGIVRCPTTRYNPNDCSLSGNIFDQRHYKKTLRIKRYKSGGVLFCAERKFRMRVYVNGIKRIDRHSNTWDEQYDCWDLGFFFYGPGALEIIRDL